MELRKVVRFLLSFVPLFALYVPMHGDFGAGGGFQDGVIFSAGLVLCDRVFGDGGA
jgi:multicomponent Na+:H+ antiporter subunit B